MSEGSIILGRTMEIATLERHYKAFTKTHPLELTAQMLTETHQVTLMRREIFELENDILPCKIAIDVTGIKQALSSHQLPFNMHEGELNDTWVDYILRSSGIEEEGVKHLQLADLRRPGIMIWWGGTVTTMIDGNHRLVRRWREGMKKFEYALIKVTHLRKFIAPVGHPPQSYKEALEEYGT